MGSFLCILAKLKYKIWDLKRTGLAGADSSVGSVFFYCHQKKSIIFIIYLCIKNSCEQDIWRMCRQSETNRYHRLSRSRKIIHQVYFAENGQVQRAPNSFCSFQPNFKGISSEVLFLHLFKYWLEMCLSNIINNSNADQIKNSI